MLKNTLLFLTIVKSGVAIASSVPEPLKFVDKQGGEVVDAFDAPSGFTGYIIDFRGNALTVYLTEDKQFLFTGKMLDSTGRDMGETALSAYITGPQSEKTWQALASSNWIPDGDKDAERVIYTFTDPNCPYCKKFWQQARPWVEAGKIQIRHILVGILKADSFDKSAAILSAENPATALYQHESGNEIDVRAIASLSDSVKGKLNANHALMQSLGVSATPAIYYKDGNNAVSLQMGLPGKLQLEQIMGAGDDQ
ncbi:thiol:disulfide interchange protein DsbG [Salinimonas sp. HHU 13199]|uniref:Thiol:disulfide interchange protein n=1 Tax=Salinimonas profundi TaxID=2729140 RepID=A0ABR8LNB9_9ALTE|nr:thiol:disulfide interchange protein DsbG [Salinimonas profundi]MBD3587680.1 thiol:disulfide interchange protein DsbG [Salinimonas profundi]